MKPGWRIATVGIMIAALFVMLVLRMWFLQVTDLEDSLEVAASQRITVVSIEAPRGDIFDRDGTEIMAGTVPSLRVMVDRKLVPLDREEGLIQNLSALLGIRASDIRQEFIDQGSGTRFSIGDPISQSMAVFVLENIERFPGVAIEPVPVRVYPLGHTAAHIIGYIGAPGPEDLGRQGIDPNDRVGKFGVERSYDRLLRGTPGRITYSINARGEILGVIDETAPRPGGSVVTTIDLDLQRFVEDTLEKAMSLAAVSGETDVLRAAAVVIDPRDGSVLAMASVPAFDPTVFADGRITTTEWETFDRNGVLNNFAIQGNYPPGSSFKPIVYTLALEEGISPVVEEEYRDIIDQERNPYAFFSDGELLFTNTPPLRDWREGGHGFVDLSKSLVESVNTYYWSIALAIWQQRDIEWSENLLQDWARRLGFGSRTGIDLPFEATGLVPDREWFQEKQQAGSPLVRAEGGWAGGDLMNIATGQGALIVTPLQMAVAYAAILNGGTVWEPRVVSEVVDSENNVIFTNLPSAARTVAIDPETVDALKRDLHGVVSAVRNLDDPFSGDGTARRAFERFCGQNVPNSQCASFQEVGGKTGTAEILQATEEGDVEDVDTAWFVGGAPLSDPQFIVAVVIDQGGSGGQVAAPAARRILQYLLGEDPEALRAGDDTER
ncbi:MAG TPA: penicillin-binding protein 2 [Acidimicrobiia bacterium]|nr:penicillin-binding protein 2 [Acidimicrobiia bacterium]